MSKTHPFMQQLEAQAANRLDYPNIPTQRFDSIKRQLQLYMLKTYGIRIYPNGTPASTKVDFMVLAVNGSFNATTANLKRDVIYIANQVFNPPPGTSMLLTTPKNIGVKVTVKQSLGNGAIAVNERLTEDILSINSAKEGANFPFLHYEGPFTI